MFSFEGKIKWLKKAIAAISTLLVNPSNAAIDFRRQNLPSVDVRFWRLKSIQAL